MWEEKLKSALDERLSTTPENLATAIGYSLLAPGKRIRPRLALSCAQMLDLPEEVGTHVGIAVEMIHCYTLIHDDLPCMDNDDFRRGKPSNHKVHGEAIALLAGDSLMPIAYETLFELTRFAKPEHFVKTMNRFNWAVGPRGVIAGQAREFLLTKKSSLEDLKMMHALKTGALFEAPVLMPMDLAGISEDSHEGKVLTRYAKIFGLAFQAADDIDDADEDKVELSILRHKSKEEAKKEFFSLLDDTHRQIKETWPQSSKNLIEASESLLKKLV